MQTIIEAVDYLYSSALEITGSLKPEDRKRYQQICTNKKEMILESLKEKPDYVKIRNLINATSRLENG